MDKYYFGKGDQRLGPFTLQQLIEQNITLNTLVWKKGMANWLPAAQVPEVANYLQPPPIPTAQVSQVAQSVPQSPTHNVLPSSPLSEKGNSKLKQIFIVLAAIVALIAILFAIWHFAFDGKPEPPTDARYAMNLTDLQRNWLRGAVKAVHSAQYDVENRNGQWVAVESSGENQESYFYDRQGMLTLKRFFSSHDGDLLIETRYHQESVNRVDISRFDDGKESRYVLTPIAKNKEKQFPNDIGGWDEWTYENQYLKKIEGFDSKGRLWVFGTYDTDENGYLYSTNTTFLDLSPPITSSFDFERIEYDTLSNWTKRLIYRREIERGAAEELNFSNKSPVSITIRTIEYY